MKEEIQKLPKIELHLHLDGSVRIETAKELLGYNPEEDMISRNSKSLKEYLTKFDIPIKLMQTKENLERIAKELGEDLVKDNIIYAEIRFCPLFHTKEGLSLDEVIESVLNGLKSVNIKTNLILCMMRGFNKEDNFKIIDTAKKYLNNGVCGIDLAGDERLYKNEDYQELFNYADSLNIPYTIHTGEINEIESVKQILKLNPKRFGHGIAIIKDKELLEEVKKRNITLEVCPKSNLDTNNIECYINHPIKKLIENNVLVTINTDNRTVSNIDLKGEYLNLYNELNMNIDDFYKCNINSINAAFIDNNLKDELKNIINREYHK